MRLSTLFGQRLREVPADAELPGHQLALRAGLIRQVAQGIYAHLPLGWRVIRRIEEIIRQEMDGIGAQEISMPVVQPAELWQASGRYQAPSPGPALARLQDRSGHPLVLGMTHEEVVTDLARQEIHSHRQLPCLVYQVQIKFRDEPRSRGGLVRTREFLMKDAYSFDRDVEGMARVYERVYGAYQRIFARCGLPVLPVEAASGMMGGQVSHEFMYLSPYGEDELLTCPACGYAANVEGARIRRTPPPDSREPLPIEEIATPGQTTIAALAQYLAIDAAQTLKAVFLEKVDTAELVFCVIRGNLDVNEVKVSSVLGGAELAPASEETLRRAGMVPGYASPIGFTGIVVVDESALQGANYVAGANRPGFHLRNVNVPRDFQPGIVADIALARSGDGCPHCGAPLQVVRAIEVGHVFQLGDKYARALKAGYLDEDGRSQPLLMGCYGIGLGRLMACVMEEHHDDLGIIWPTAVAPFEAHLVSLARTGTEEEQVAERLYHDLTAAGLEVIYDDRPERAGVKFNDADLMGVPVRLTLSPRTLARGAVELKHRWGGDVSDVPLEPLDGLVSAIREARWPA